MPLPPPDERALQAVGARPRESSGPSPAAIVRVLRELARESEALVAVFDAGAIAGERHLLSAWAHLGRSRGRGEARLRDRGAEFALYVAGDDQLPRALAKVGVSESTEEYVVVAERPRDLASLLERFDLIPAPEAYPRAPDGRTMERLGIGAEERSSVPPAAWEGLVLERVALLDLSASSGHAPTAKH